jgi:hypothetical protein
MWGDFQAYEGYNFKYGGLDKKFDVRRSIIWEGDQ